MINVTDTLGLKNDAPDELILRKIHFQRVKKDFPDFVKDYLCVRYLKTNDVRFFNELGQVLCHLLPYIDGFVSSLLHEVPLLCEGS